MYDFEETNYLCVKREKNKEKKYKMKYTTREKKERRILSFM